MAPARLLASSLLLALLAAAPAHGSTVSVTAGELVVAGGPAREILYVQSDGGPISISDSGGAITTTDPACEQIGGSVRCEPDDVGRVVLDLGDGDDVALGAISLPVTIRAGNGDDYVDPGRMRGADVLDGGPGTDTLTYREAPGPVRLDGPAGTATVAAAPMTADAIAGFERAQGTGYDDVINVRDGVTGGVQCWGGTDTAVVDWNEGAAECEHVDRPAPPTVTHARPTPSRGSTPAGRKRRARGKVALVGQPVVAQATVALKLSAPVQGVMRATLAVGGQELQSETPATDDAPEVRFDLPGPAAAQLQATGRVRTKLNASLTPDDPSTAPLTGLQADRTLTLLRKPPSAFRLTGRKRSGGFGRQRLRGTGRGDRLSGDSGDDRLLGLGGNDRLGGGTGNDTLLGGAGHDDLDGYDGDDDLRGGPGDDRLIESRFGDDTLSGGAGDDWLYGGRGVDTLLGGPGDDVINGGSGSDTVDCGPGYDVVIVNLEIEKTKSRAKHCEEIQEEGDIVSVPCADGDGTEGPETMLGTDGRDVCRGLGGDDDLEGAGGDDRLDGGAGDDRLFGRFGKDELLGGPGDDELEGGRGRDLLDGGPGNDKLNGGYDPDVVRGGAGNDYIRARGGGRDVIDCGPGKDRAVVDSKDVVRNCEIVNRS